MDHNNHTLLWIIISFVKVVCFYCLIRFILVPLVHLCQKKRLVRQKWNSFMMNSNIPPPTSHYLEALPSCDWCSNSIQDLSNSCKLMYYFNNIMEAEEICYSCYLRLLSTQQQQQQEEECSTTPLTESMEQIHLRNASDCVPTVEMRTATRANSLHFNMLKKAGNNWKCASLDNNEDNMNENVKKH